jgi:Protein of unknown function (DUF3892)
MPTAQIKCVMRNPRGDLCHRITDIGGFTDRHWQISVEDAIEHLEGGAWEFYTMKGGERRMVVIANRAGRKYLKSEGDGETPDTLLALPDCPDRFD